MNNYFYFLIGFIIILLAIILIVQLSQYKKGGTKYRRSWGKHYELVKLLTKNEYSFYIQIRKLLPAEVLIFPKVRMEDFLEVVARENYKYRGYVRCRHVDFLLCTPSLKIICGLELDDKSHATKEAKQVDRLKNDIFKEIRVPLLRCYNNKKDVNHVVNEILNLYEKKGI